jgi:L-alanine-DL-glutamate epimerase-like enolase superfamily enzyme
MKIADIDIIPIYPKLATRNADQKTRFQSLNHRTIFKITTDNNITGYGDIRSPAPPKSSVEDLLGRNPFDFINANLNTGLMGALYDVMGKHLEIPAYKLMGQKVRDRVPVAAWTRPASPEDLAKEVQRAASEGYMTFKMHTCAHYDVFEQNQAVEEVAPPGFRMHYDFNHNRPLTSVLRILHKLEDSEVVGMIEDPLVLSDIHGWQLLRQKTSFPLLMHVPQLGGGQELMHGCADAYMIGEAGIGSTLALAFACAKANVSTVIQLTGGTLTKAMAMHMGAVIPHVSHSTNLDDQYDEDVVKERFEVSEGSSPVPETPGLGVEIDEAALERAASNKPTEIPHTIGILHLPGGHKVYTQSYPDVAKVTGYAEGNIRGIRLELREDDGSEDFQKTWDRITNEGPFTE